MQKIKTLLLCLLLMSSVSCTMRADEVVVGTGLNEQCLGPLYNSSFPVGDEAFTFIATTTPKPSILAPAAWQKVSEFSSSNGEILDLHFISIQDGNQIFWFTAKEKDETRIWTYNVNDKVWKFGPSVSKEAELFFDNFGNVWIHEPLHEKPSSLYRLNPETLAIESESEKNILFAERNIKHLATTPDGKLWLIMTYEPPQLHLYQYDPFTLELTEHLTPDNYIGLATDDKGVVFMATQDGIVQSYDSETGELDERHINTYNGPIPTNFISMLTTDGNELWLSDVEKFQISDEGLINPQVILRSPVFVTTQFNGYQPLTWERPDPQVETEDGRIWFKSSRGLVWHQPETGEWCMFTSADSNIVNDTQGNLWIVYENALYMLPAEETKAKE